MTIKCGSSSLVLGTLRLSPVLPNFQAPLNMLCPYLCISPSSFLDILPIFKNQFKHYVLHRSSLISFSSPHIGLTRCDRCPQCASESPHFITESQWSWQWLSRLLGRDCAAVTFDSSVTIRALNAQVFAEEKNWEGQDTRDDSWQWWAQQITGTCRLLVNTYKIYENTGGGDGTYYNFQ